ncbi:MAG TPA: glutathione S-transferase family protein [Caulobacteraceae bacterium]
MDDPDTAPISLHMAPGTCARVPAIALFEAGAAFEPRLVRFLAGEHRSAAYLTINPLGKVPALFIDGAVITENVAIVSHLAHRFPEAGLMPVTTDALQEARQIADLCYCAATLHPIVTRIRIPTMFAETPEAQASVYRRATETMLQSLAVAERRLQDGAWWYGERWSLMDAYLNWVWFRIAGAGFEPGPFPSWRTIIAAMRIARPYAGCWSWRRSLRRSSRRRD